MKNDKRDILLHLYGEAPEGSDLRTLLKDEELQSEHAALSEAKFRLDLRNKEKPDQAVLDRILAAAAGDSDVVTPAGRVDRPPVARIHRLKKVLIPAFSIAAAVVFGIAIGWFGGNSSSVTPAGTPALADDTVVPPESLYRYVPPRQNAIQQTGAKDPRLAWDDASSLPSLRQRINTLNPSSNTDWGSSALPLEVLPGSQNRGFQTAGSNN